MRRPKSPFKSRESFIRDITGFLYRHRAKFRPYAYSINQYFEMLSYNCIVRFYKNYGYTVSASNMFGGEFRYKLSPTGYPKNFSYFTLKKAYKLRGGLYKEYEFEVHHNLAVESSIQVGIFSTPDIAIIRKGSIVELKDPRYFFSGGRAYNFVRNDDLLSFCEAKNMNPFPELLYNYIGVLNEIKNDVFNSKQSDSKPKHIAPSLMISGGGSYHTRKIRESLLSRYHINIFFGMFYGASKTYSKHYQPVIRKIGTRK